MPKMKQFVAKIHTFQAGVLKDNVSAVKEFIKNVPPEALFRIKGLTVPDFKISPFSKATDEIPIDTSDMSMLEIACCARKTKIFKFMTELLNMRKSRDFLVDRRNKWIQEQRFVFIPILNRDEHIFEGLLELSNIWSVQDLQDLMLFCKQAKWIRGVEIVLQSKSCTRQFLCLDHVEQNRFCHKALQLAYELTDEEVTGKDASETTDLHISIPITQ